MHHFMTRIAHNFPLHLYIATLFIGLILAVGLVLGWFNLERNERILLSASHELFQRIADEGAGSFTSNYRLSATLVELGALSSLPQARTLEQRLAILTLLDQALRRQPSLSALQVGYQNGDFFIVRRIPDEVIRERFEAPAEAVYVVDNISNEGPESTLQRLYLDARLQRLGQRTLRTPYDPRHRAWYRQAMESDGTTHSNPYLYYFIRRIGITVARTDPLHTAVVAADITLGALSRILKQHRVSPSAELLVFDQEGQVIAYRDPDRLVRRLKGEEYRIAHVSDLGSEVLTAEAERIRPEAGDFRFEHGGRTWHGSIRKLPEHPGSDLYLAVLAPEEELLGEAHRIANTTALITAGIILLSLPLAWFFARSISRPLRKLSRETQLIQILDFHSPVTTNSHIYEIRLLAQGMDAMKQTINKFLRLITSLAGEQDFQRLLQRITAETLETSGVDGAGVLLVDEEERFLQPTLWQSGDDGWQPRLKPIATTDPAHPFIKALSSGAVEVLELEERDAGPLQPLFEDGRHKRLRLALFPLRDRRQEPMGLLFLVSRKPARRHEQNQEQEWLAFVRSLTDFAAVSLETRMLLRSQKALLDAFIEVIAGAIDAKSPYTGGHCQRVPELTRMLSEAAARSEEPPFRDYRPDAGHREALEIAAWLHDCGKVTTPEHVVDKATRLETLYDRIHEIRMRFEVLKRDAWIQYWQGRAEGAEPEALAARRDRQLAKLDKEFVFVAECNQGDCPMTPERVARLRRIARRRWTRTLSDRMGISWAELKRRARTPAPPLPVEEPLLADWDHHRIPRDEQEKIPPDNPWGFRLQVPEYKFNLGELHNLTVAQGTLTEEERYLVNEHIMQTILMLEQLPYPRHLREVPRLAGGHHEKIDGTGYPRRLKGEELPLGARIMAIADIFEALTASDRPYKKAKTLDEAIHILWIMSREGHIDPDLFRLFLRSGIHLQYAQKYLAPEQIDEVEIATYLGIG
jgi:HD-GYP domain-containing protein (c-di-GMP phosphodiesterase class II)/HAMP domain-containing protein